VALLFLGPDKLPQAAKSISKGIRDIKRHSRALQQQIENDEQIGGALRDIKSALRGDELPVRRPAAPPRPRQLAEGSTGDPPEGGEGGEGGDAAPAEPTEAGTEAGIEAGIETTPAGAAAPVVTLPRFAGEPDPEVAEPGGDDELAALIKPASGTVAKGS
jgi:sec-independent protein translocase protein TatB